MLTILVAATTESPTLVASIGLVGALGAAIIVASLTAYLTGRQRTVERKADWARQDTIAANVRDAAAQAAQAAELLRLQGIEVAANAEKVRLQAVEAATLLLAENRRVAATAAQQGALLGQVHTLVNSNLLEAMQAQLKSEDELISARMELAGMKPPDPNTQAGLDALRAKAEDLRREISDRVHQTDIADSEKAAKDSVIPDADTP